MQDRRFGVHEIEVVVKIKFKVAVTDAEKQLAKYPDSVLKEIKEELGYERLQLVSSAIKLIQDDIPTFEEADRILQTDNSIDLLKEKWTTYFEGKHKRFTPDFESDIPDFENREEAQKWFMSMFAEDFVLSSAFSIGDRMCWNYIVIHNRDEWTMGQKLLEQGLPAGEDYLWSYQSIQLFENGDVHIVF